ncbi:epoxide hydrolase family protein [Cellulomonas fengjieae]|uniref:epoxide hydrolase family protein n=1 Tax=Cellulomonas fengjieae TaxID=2819978 RepID=UPI001AAEC7CA|nr:epoxide hydrolase family protein [Cellulomonas fengjieae]MBO3102422.1 epoxide hydrolase [Cellulomonas fengjieae]
MTAEPFAAAVPDEDLRDLRDRLRRTRWPLTLESAGWARGVPVAYLRDLVGHWVDGYDWHRVQARLDTVDQVRTQLDGQTIHALHARSARPDALPLVLTHGWPGSVLEYVDLLGPLTAAGPDAFHVVVPHLPGVGWSAPLSGEGWDHRRVARAWAALMASLGYDRYGAAGGDTGSVVSPELGRVAPQHVVGVHVHGNLDVPQVDPASLTAAEAGRLAWAQHRRVTDTGYSALQSTRPHTIGYALADSPVAQLAWIVDKFHDWTDPAVPDPAQAVGRDHLLDLATLLWVTGTGPTSAHLYYENRVATVPERGPDVVPFGHALFPTDPAIRHVDQREHRLVHWTEHERGGHFAALEAPDLLVEDLRTFFRPLR